MTQPRLPPRILRARGAARSDLRGLFQAITRAALASGCLSGCASEHDPGEPEVDAGSGPDGAVTEPRDAAIEASVDASRPADSGVEVWPDSGVVIPTTGWDPIACDQMNSPLPLVGLKPARMVDYLGNYRLYGSSGGTFVTPATELLSTGDVCAGLTNVPACETQLGAILPPEPCEVGGRCTIAAVARVGAQLTRIDTKEQLLALLGTIDASAEALLVAQLGGFQVSCAQDSYLGPLRGTEIRATGSGFELRTHYESCGAGVLLDQLSVDAAGNVSALDSRQLATSSCAIGRRPEGLCSAAPVSTRTALGGFFAQAARLEAASVYAFLQLARELAQLDAPRALIEACLAAVDDELRHTGSVAALARRFGGEPQLPTVEPLAPRSAFEIARQNASEGCVRETFGALLATHQAQAALDPPVRRAMQAICADETRHAQLSWALAAWLEPQLRDDERAAIRSCRDQAIAELKQQLDTGLSPDECLAIGFPSPQISARLLDRLGDTLWS